MRRSAHLLFVYNVSEAGLEEYLNEEDGYNKYRQSRFAYYPILIAVIGTMFAVLFGLVVEIPLFEAEDPLAMYVTCLCACTLIMGSISQLILLIRSFQTTKHLYESITITFELFMILIFYFLTLVGVHGLLIFSNYSFQNWFFSGIGITLKNTVPVSMILLLVRNVIWITVGIFSPVRKRNNFYVIEYGENPECKLTLEIILSSKVGYTYFARFICENFNPHGCELLNLFCLLMVWKEKQTYNKSSDRVEMEIRDFHRTSKYIKDTIALTEDYIRLMKNILKRLRIFYNEFRQSEYYEALHKALQARQVINERLRFANLI